MLSAPTMAPMMVPRPPSATMTINRVPNVKLAFSGAATPPKAAYPKPARAATMAVSTRTMIDRKSTRLNSSHTVIYTLSLHDALPICSERETGIFRRSHSSKSGVPEASQGRDDGGQHQDDDRSEEHTSELQSHSDLHSFPTRRSSDLFRT